MPSDFSRIEKAITYLEANFQNQPRLDEVSRHVGLSEFHFQRVFRRWAGISPKRFLQYLTAEYACDLLENNHSVLDAAYAAGLSGPGRLHDLMVNVHAATPGEIRERGEGLTIRYGLHPSPFGRCLVATTERGICGLAFVGPEPEKDVLTWLYERWGAASLLHSDSQTRTVVERIFSQRPGDGVSPLTLFLAGTNFQIKVWEALLRIPPGAVVSYEDLAASVGRPRAVRAVACAVGGNPVSFLVPCHRVIRKSGDLGGYRWGLTRKRAMLAWEAARASSHAA